MRLIILGAVIAGGQSRRFGSDKAEALFQNRRLIDHVIGGLGAQTDRLVVCGRFLAGYACIEDRPRAGLGPLGGLAAALHHADTHGFTGVLTSACDTPLMPSGLAQLLIGPEAAIIGGQPLFGYWPSRLSQELDDFLANSETRALGAWAQWTGARMVQIGAPVANINTAGDLAALVATARYAP